MAKGHTLKVSHHADDADGPAVLCLVPRGVRSRRGRGVLGGDPCRGGGRWRDGHRWLLLVVVRVGAGMRPVVGRGGRAARWRCEMA